MSASTDVAIIGAGPYGLSIATHLRMRGLDHRIVGSPMHFWLKQMPKGMLLKSEGFASTLYDPEERFTLRQFCEEQGIAYTDIGVPVTLETFSAYGLAFQKRLVPELENKTLMALERSSSGFLLRLDNEESFTARRVLLATGISHFRHIPAELEHLPPEFISHSSEHSDLGGFKGRDVTVIGGGASAIDLATLLHERGTIVRLITRGSSLVFHGKMKWPRPRWKRIRHPISGIGPGWRLLFFSDAPLIFHYLPERIRLQAVRRVLGPAGGWFMKDRFAGIPALLGSKLRRAEITNGRVRLIILTADGISRNLTTEHVIAATGFNVDVRRLSFLSEGIRSQLRSTEHVPVLSSHFESSIPGLYVVGPASANSFGPVMKFAFGAKFAAPHIARHLAAVSLVPAPSKPPATALTARRLKSMGTEK